MLRVTAGHEGPFPSIRRTSTAKTRGLGAGAKLTAHGRVVAELVPPGAKDERRAKPL
jgi:hypothetical protein